MTRVSSVHPVRRRFETISGVLNGDFCHRATGLGRTRLREGMPDMRDTAVCVAVAKWAVLGETNREGSGCQVM